MDPQLQALQEGLDVLKKSVGGEKVSLYKSIHYDESDHLCGATKMVAHSSGEHSEAINLFKFWNIVPIMISNNTRQGYVFGPLIRSESNLKLAGYLFLAPLKPLFARNKQGML